MKKLKLQELGRVSVEEYQQVEKLPLVVVLDGIRSAHNVGSIFRTADAMAIEKIMLCDITPQPPSREITKTAIGATESVEWQYFEHVTDALQQLRSEGYYIMSIEQTDASVELMEVKLEQQKIALVLGNEVFGVSDDALRKSDLAIEINQYGTKHSLNVSICGGIVIHHFANLLRSR